MLKVTDKKIEQTGEIELSEEDLIEIACDFARHERVTEVAIKDNGVWRKNGNLFHRGSTF